MTFVDTFRADLRRANWKDEQERADWLQAQAERYAAYADAFLGIINDLTRDGS